MPASVRRGRSCPPPLVFRRRGIRPRFCERWCRAPPPPQQSPRQQQRYPPQLRQRWPPSRYRQSKETSRAIPSSPRSRRGPDLETCEIVSNLTRVMGEMRPGWFAPPRDILGHRCSPTPLAPLPPSMPLGVVCSQVSSPDDGPGTVTRPTHTPALWWGRP